MNSILTVSSILFPLITFRYISGVLLVEGSGKVAFAVSVLEYFTMFASLGIPTYGVRACARVRDDKEKLSRTVQELLIINTCTTAITYAVFFAALFLVPQFAARREILFVMAISIGLNVIGVQWFYSALEQYSYITTCSILFKIIGMILMFILVKNQDDYLIYGAVYVIASFGSYALNFLRLHKFISFRKTGRYDFKKHLKSVAVFFAMSAGTSIYLNLDVVMLGFMKGEMDVGYYNAGVKVKSVLVTCVTSLGTVLLPRLSYYIEKDNHDAFLRMVTKAFNFVLVAASAVTLYFILFAKESILLLAQKAFLPGTQPMIILMPTVLLIGLSNITGIQILTPMGQEKKVMYSIWGGAILDFALNLVLIPRFAASGAAFSTLLAEVMVLGIQCVFLKDMLKKMVGKLKIWKIGIGLTAGAVGALIFKANTDMQVFPTLVISALLFFGIYGGILIALKEAFVMDILKSVSGLYSKRNQ